MREYRIVRQNNNAKPFSLWTFESFGACYTRFYVYNIAQNKSIGTFKFIKSMSNFL